MVTLKSTTIQIGIRFDRNLIKELDEVAKEIGYERNFLIKKIIREELTDIKKELREEATNDYLDFRITEKEYERILGEKPDKEIKESRKELMKGLVEKRNKKNENE